MTDAAPGDGVVSLPILSLEETEMPGIDLPEGVGQVMMTETAANIQANNRQGRDTFTMASGAMQAGVAKTLNELGPVESRAVSGVMASPIGPPSPQPNGG